MSKGYDQPHILVFNDQFSFLKALKIGQMIDNDAYVALRDAEWERLALVDGPNLLAL